jgi:chain length determinant protein tyrosine kinase EpsG
MMMIENGAHAAAQSAAMKDSSIGRVLLDMGKITPGDAARVLALQAQKGMRFGEAARQLGLVSEADIELVLASQFDYQYVQASQTAMDPALVVAMNPFGEEAEMLRALRGQLTVRWFSGHRTLAVVGVDAKASASVVAANLALVFAQQGQRTLLVDANMRKPRQQDLFRVGAKTGLSDALAGRVSDLRLVPVPPFDKLSLLCAGTPPPNPLELLGRPTFGALNEGFARAFDVVLYDAPAFSASADAYAIAARARGVLLVVSKRHTRQAELKEVRSQLLRGGVEIVGSIMVDF